ncbi:MAG: hypothetical protein JNK77_15915 [Saprospiraceae bacterium]|nr:hypothetical protein [Saprospiraceae bacterium]
MHGGNFIYEDARPRMHGGNFIYEDARRRMHGGNFIYEDPRLKPQAECRVNYASARGFSRGSSFVCRMSYS